MLKKIRSNIQNNFQILSNKDSLKSHALIIILFFVGLALRLYAASLDPFLHDWDEKYHALVAKNMISHPFKPMLYVNNMFRMDQNTWCCNHVWLHKQPLFLWQMALSMKLFGVSEFTLRLPSVLMGSLMILLVYRISMLTTSNKMTSLIASTLLCFSYYYLNLISGREGMDHNDIAFCFYVLCSIWAYTEYIHKTSLKWVFLTGLFAGCAVLNKWLTGLLVFAPWGIQVIIDLIDTKKINSIVHFLIAVAICILVFAPWQIYILYAFHDLAVYEYTYNNKHIWEAVEGHTGSIWYYLNKFPIYFGEVVNYLVPIGLILIFLKKSIPKKYLLVLILPLLLVFSFFSFIVQTKVTAYFIIAIPICMILASIVIQSIIEVSGRFKLPTGIVIVFACAYWSLNIRKINEYTYDKNYRLTKIHNTEIYKKIDALVPSNINMVINLNAFEHVDVMFFSKRFTAYHYCFSENDFAKIIQKGIPIAAFESHDNYLIPEYIMRYKYLFVIKKQLK